jgi:hypothetical protein
MGKKHQINGYLYGLFFALFLCMSTSWGYESGKFYRLSLPDVATEFFNADDINDKENTVNIWWEIDDQNKFTSNLLGKDVSQKNVSVIEKSFNAAGEIEVLKGKINSAVDPKTPNAVPSSLEYEISVIDKTHVRYKFTYFEKAPSVKARINSTVVAEGTALGTKITQKCEGSKKNECSVS